jgi:hypothetical protein
MVFVAAHIVAGDGRQEIEAMEKAWSEAVQRNDADDIGNFLHAEFTFVNPRGVLLHRAQHLDDFRQSDQSLPRLSYPKW